MAPAIRPPRRTTPRNTNITRPWSTVTAKSVQCCHQNRRKHQRTVGWMAAGFSGTSLGSGAGRSRRTLELANSKSFTAICPIRFSNRAGVKFALGIQQPCPAGKYVHAVRGTAAWEIASTSTLLCHMRELDNCRHQRDTSHIASRYLCSYTKLSSK